MTEDEMKTKTCYRTLGPVASADGSAPWFSPQACVGSQCSAWRWVDKAGTDEAGQPNYYAGRWQGYCGPAGKP